MTEKERAAALADRLGAYSAYNFFDTDDLPIVVAALRAYSAPVPDDVREAVYDAIMDHADLEWVNGQWVLRRPDEMTDAAIAALQAAGGPREETDAARDVLADECTCRRFPTHCANDCPLHGEVGYVEEK
jgi:hypothetical protein